jgi:hypothetical protein
LAGSAGAAKSLSRLAETKRIAYQALTNERNTPAGKRVSTIKENAMYTLFVTTQQAWQTLALVFGGFVFGAISAALIMTYFWTMRTAQLEERGERYRERIRHRFERLHEQMTN